MVFIQGTYDAPTILSTLVQALALTDDFEEYDTGVSDGYCLRHIPSNTFIWMFCDWVYYGGTTGNPSTVANHSQNPGIRVIFSTAWDSDNHTSSGTINNGFIPFVSEYALSIDPIVSPRVFPISMHVDKYGWVMTIQNNYHANGALSVCEFFPDSWVEYDDTQKKIVLFSERAVNYQYNSSVYHLKERSNDTTQTVASREGFTYVRPFRFTCQTQTGTHEGCKKNTFKAFKSEGNNKTYFDFPWYENDLIAARKPYAQTRRWFRVDHTGGFSIGDILNWIDPDAVTVHKYIVSMMQTGNYYAIPYENAFDYAVSAKQ